MYLSVNCQILEKVFLCSKWVAIIKGAADVDNDQSTA